jgi:cytochrome P450 / NADPH-cytochrome P450 reductase
VTAPIPSPRGLPVVGNGLQVPAGNAYVYFDELAKDYPDGIYQVDLAGRQVVCVYDPELVAEVCDESRFYKPIDPPLAYVRDFAGDGLFTATEDEESWGHAHRILLPAFSQRSMKAYFPQMLDVARDLVGHWRAHDEVDVTEDMTRLTLDTIALSGFGQEFRSFGKEELHPFLRAMGNALTEARLRVRQIPAVTALKKKADAAYRADIAVMHELVDQVIRDRRATGEKKRDLLGLMLDASDPVSGERLTDENIRNQVLTFLIAGHETTSGTLSFALSLLMRHPHVLAQAYAEVDRVLGGAEPTYESIMKLDVIPRVLNESLRLYSPLTAIGLMAREDTVVGGRWPIPKGRKVAILTGPLHRHPKAWAEPDSFDIDRWLPGREPFPHSYKPFGNGARACIGRQFALTEARLALALVLQNFALTAPDGHRLSVKQTLTIKPTNFILRVRDRAPIHTSSPSPSPSPSQEPETEPVELRTSGIRMTVAYGSNLGTSEELARGLADRARRSGFDVALMTLDELADSLPASGLLTVVAASYNGRAPDNAQRFDDLSIEPGALDGLTYALLGNGNVQWNSTYQAFPKRVEEKLTGAGASPIVARGEIDAAGDFDGMATAWLGELWAALASRYGSGASVDEVSGYDVEVLGEDQTRPAVVPGHAYPIEVVELRELTTELAPAGVKSVTVRLPEGAGYVAGDHIAVYAKNDPSLVAWALKVLRVPGDQVVRLSREDGPLPVGVPVAARTLLTDFIELQDPATRAQLAILAAHTACPWTTGQLAALEARYADEILAKRVSVLGLLERFPAIELGLGTFLAMTGTIKPRFYSISSSPAADPRLATLTVGLVDGPALAGSGRYRGMCSRFLAGLTPGDVFYGHVRVPSPPFRAPSDPRTPMILIGAGTGIAPLRGFLEQRPRESGRVKLFFGCRHPEQDLLYGDELRAWEESGLVELHLAFSAKPDHPHRYVQHALAGAADEVRAMLESGAHVYVCGDGERMAPAVMSTLAEIYGRDFPYQQDVFA